MDACSVAAMRATVLQVAILAPATSKPGVRRALICVMHAYTALQDVAPFEIAILSHVFEHLSEPRTLMEQIKPMLAPGGLNRPGMSGDSTSWEGWSHARFVEGLPAGVAG